MKRARALSLAGGTLLITSTAYLMVYGFDPFELGDEFKSPAGAALCVLGIAAGAALAAASIAHRRHEKRLKREAAAARLTPARRPPRS
jgi:hypothetical protein